MKALATNDMDPEMLTLHQFVIVKLIATPIIGNNGAQSQSHRRLPSGRCSAYSTPETHLHSGSGFVHQPQARRRPAAARRYTRSEGDPRALFISDLSNPIHGVCPWIFVVRRIPVNGSAIRAIRIARQRVVRFTDFVHSTAVF